MYLQFKKQNYKRRYYQVYTIFIAKSTHLPFFLKENVCVPARIWIETLFSELDEDEILSLASQAVEYDERVNTFQNGPKHNSRNTFNLSLNTRSSKDPQKCGSIGPGSKPNSNGMANDKILEHLRDMQEENKKYQAQQSELAENNMVKNGEIAILRAQLKSCKVEITNVRMENLKNTEKNQMEFTDKLKRLNAEMQKQKSELDLKVDRTIFLSIFFHHDTFWSLPFAFRWWKSRSWKRNAES